MLLRTMAAAGALATMGFTTDAFCQGQYQYRDYYIPKPDPLLHFLFFLIVFLAALLLYNWIVEQISSESSSCTDDDDDDRIAREADLMREITKQQDAHTAMMRSEIDHARTYGEYRERPEIAEHEQRLRELRSKLR